jgi:hypothetical protein
MNCMICNTNEATLKWNPFPANLTAKFDLLPNSRLGMEICWECQNDLINNLPTEFNFYGDRYIGTLLDGFRKVPDYVDDALLWWEET